ncbi:MAG: hypothetical protein GY797_34785 [Deltaproteobacteria bacterium]|nr:hypothetical protein [Deltaproteobacteria bacterium]
MKKIISLFKRDYESTRQVYNEVVPGSDWVLAGEGVATVKYDGTCCLVRDGKLYRRYDRKLSKSANKRKRKDKSFAPGIEHFKPAPDGWEAAELEPNKHTGHWPGWLPVSETNSQDQWHKEAWKQFDSDDGTYELVGPKVQGNPYNLDVHKLIRHGEEVHADNDPPRDFEGLKIWLEQFEVEGIVWHHPDGRMVKIKRRDFGLEWPVKTTFAAT